MSRLIINKSAPRPIPIRNNKYSYSMPFSNFSKYLFELKIKFKNNEERYFRKIENIKKAELISQLSSIKYDMIESFKINITVLPHGIDKIYTLNGSVDKNCNTSTKSNNYIFIEFTKNFRGHLICTCHFIGQDIHKLSCSPSI